MNFKIKPLRYKIDLNRREMYGGILLATQNDSLTFMDYHWLRDIWLLVIQNDPDAEFINSFFLLLENIGHILLSPATEYRSVTVLRKPFQSTHAHDVQPGFFTNIKSVVPLRQLI